jgi:hypothetical protein
MCNIAFSRLWVSIVHPFLGLHGGAPRRQQFQSTSLSCANLSSRLYLPVAGGQQGRFGPCFQTEASVSSGVTQPAVLTGLLYVICERLSAVMFPLDVIFIVFLLKIIIKWDVLLYLKGKRQSYPCNRPWRPIGLWDVEALMFSRQSAHSWRSGWQPYAPAAFYP